MSASGIMAVPLAATGPALRSCAPALTQPMCPSSRACAGSAGSSERGERGRAAALTSRLAQAVRMVCRLQAVRMIVCSQVTKVTQLWTWTSPLLADAAAMPMLSSAHIRLSCVIQHASRGNFRFFCDSLGLSLLEACLTSSNRRIRSQVRVMQQSRQSLIPTVTHMLCSKRGTRVRNSSHAPGGRRLDMSVTYLERKNLFK